MEVTPGGEGRYIEEVDTEICVWLFNTVSAMKESLPVESYGQENAHYIWEIEEVMSPVGVKPTRITSKMLL